MMADSEQYDVIDISDFAEPASVIRSVNFGFLVFGIPIGLTGVGGFLQGEDQSLWSSFLTFACITSMVLCLINNKGKSYWLSWLLFSAILMIGAVVKLISYLLEMRIVEFLGGVLIGFLPLILLFFVFCSSFIALVCRIDYFGEKLTVLMRKTDQCFNYHLRAQQSPLMVAGRVLYIGGIVGALGFPTSLILNSLVEMGWFVALEPFLTIGLLSLFALPAFGLAIVFGRRLMQPAARRDLGASRDAPILLLRAFPDDAQEITRKSDIQMLLSFGYRKNIRLEAAIAQELWRIGPFYAVGRPGEQLPRFGAAKAYFSDAEWQEAVLHWMGRSQLVVLIAAATVWVTWELKQVIDQGAISKLIILIPPDSDDARRKRWKGVVDTFKRTPVFNALRSVDIKRVIGAFFSSNNRVVIMKGGTDQEDYEYAVRLAAYGVLAGDVEGALR